MGEYQNRKDIDNLYDELYDRTDGRLNVVRFDDESPYRSIYYKEDKSDIGTMDALIRYYGIDKVNDLATDMNTAKSDISDINDRLSSILDLVYPIGSIYMSVNNVDPSVLFGGAWERLEDRFLLAGGTDYPVTYDSDGIANGTGGSADAVVVSHSHSFVEGGSSINVDTTASETTNGFGTGNMWHDVNKKRSSISSTGESGTGKNMPPYLIVNVWMRIEEE